MPFHKKDSWLRRNIGKILDIGSFIPGPQQPFVAGGSALLHGGKAAKALKDREYQKALIHGIGAGVAGKSAHSGFKGSGAAGTPMLNVGKAAGVEMAGNGGGLWSGVGGVLGGIGGWIKDNPGLALGIGSSIGGLLSPPGAGAKESDELKVELMRRALHNLDNPRVFNPYIKAARGAITGPQYLPPTPALVGEAGPEFITPLRGPGDQRAAANILGMPAMRGGGIIPELPTGYQGWVNGPHIATLGENGSEAVFPLDKLQTAAGGAISGLDNLRGGLREAIVNSIDDPNRQGSNSFVPSMLKAYDEIPKLQAGGITKGAYKQQHGMGGGGATPPPPMPAPMPAPPPVRGPGDPNQRFGGGPAAGGYGPRQIFMPPPVRGPGDPNRGGPPVLQMGGQQPGGPTKEEVMGGGGAMPPPPPPPGGGLGTMNVPISTMPGGPTKEEVMQQQRLGGAKTPGQVPEGTGEGSFFADPPPPAGMPDTTLEINQPPIYEVPPPPPEEQPPGGLTKEEVMGNGLGAPSHGEGRVVTLPDGTKQFQMDPPSNMYDDPNWDKTHTNRDPNYIEDPHRNDPGYIEPLGGPEDITEFGTGDGSFPHMPDEDQPPPGQGPIMTGGGGGGFPEGQPPGTGNQFGDPGGGDTGVGDTGVDPGVDPGGYSEGTLDPALGRSLQDVALQGRQNTPDYDALYNQLGTRAMGLINQSAAARGAFGGSAYRGQLSEGLGRLGLNIAQLQGNLRNQALQGGTNVNQNIFGVNRDIYGMNQMTRQQAWQNAMNAAGQPTSPSPWSNFFSATGNLGGQIYNTRNSPWSTQ